MIRMVEVRYALPTMFDAPWSWLSDAESGGGLLNEFGSHVVDLLRWYFGEIVTVQGCAVTIKELRQDGASQRKADADDIALMTLGWQTGLVATVALSSVFRPASAGPDPSRRFANDEARPGRSCCGVRILRSTCPVSRPLGTGALTYQPGQ